MRRLAYHGVVSDTPLSHLSREQLEAEITRLRARLAHYQRETAAKTIRARQGARRNMLKAEGRWSPEVPVGPVRDHILQVTFVAGMSVAQFSAASGVSLATLQKILYDKSRVHVKHGVAAKIMAVTTETAVPDMGYVDATGARRRVQALAVAGWSPETIAQRIGTDRSVIYKIRDGIRGRVYAGTARKIRALYDELWLKLPPEDTKGERISAARTRSYAAKQGWVAAGRWDGPEIDDPSAVPEDGRPAATGRQQRRETLLAEARELLGFGLSRDAAAKRLGITRYALDQALLRARTA